MSRGTFIVALILSAALHAHLMMIPAGHGAAPSLPPLPMVVPVVETELAEPRPEPSIVEPLPEPAKEQTPPEPEPEAAPEPEPVEPPQPDLTKVAEAPPTEQSDPGDFAGAATNEKGPPGLRINWGTGDQAIDMLDAGDMMLVILDREDGHAVITGTVVRDEGHWISRAYQPAGTTLYSNRLRIVHEVPAFDAARAAIGLRGSEQLAVLLPLRVERTLESAQLEAAYTRGLVMNQIDNFAGRFTLRDGDLTFDITHIGASERNAAQ